MSKELSHIPAPEAKVLNQNDLVIQRSTMDTRERHDYDIKEKEIREYIMDLETRYDLKKFLELENYTVLDIKDKINFLEERLNSLRQERLHKDIKFKYINLRAWYEERVNVTIGKLEGAIELLKSLE
ncbi:MAG: hypothetical protein COX80_04805 [Candidatus Magasanikbacteria bacterium CG_4_10_14_0_2_um_filter_33_14]|uniref:Uncharacterized protein n=1 Tax=Candidatus Magasanikbacteria bacterium CG_4_10_14_0_2_um_filter_33_14 TaxID=1974636 RepID=A0A2M7V8X6_9BACT|nr:MAG: hypothetical protein COX80_04805 [Candidatus Magasanikbacteria bacterium CG_4_10_14_0_2_um_filter_33_14]